ncbi:MAG: hypothetical protein IKE18_02015, partial [Oscillospiraceae bacterium]|nr:hypothetical protein [Oscillospiraceae bacterium]
MEDLFPRTMVGGVSVPRMLAGCNWISGWSHRSPAQDKMIQAVHSTPDSVADIFEVFMNQGVDACLGLFNVDTDLIDAVKMAEDRTGKKMIIFDTPVLNVDDNPIARMEAEEAIKKCAERGATFCLPIHSCVEQLVNKNKKTIERLPDYLKMIRDHGMIPGLSAHMPEIVHYSDENEY